MFRAVDRVLAMAAGAVLLAGSAYGSTTPVQVPTLVTTTCAACHGSNGVSLVSTFPDLAGQGAPYLVKQITDFRNHTRADALAKSIMWTMAATIPPNKIQQIAAFYASQQGPAGTTESATLVAAGRTLYQGGDAADHLPACAACHGSTGLGLPPLFPRLAGQHMAYVTAQLMAFKAKQRTNDPLAIMRTVSAKLTSAQMNALAAYVRSL